MRERQRDIERGRKREREKALAQYAPLARSKADKSTAGIPQPPEEFGKNVMKPVS